MVIGSVVSAVIALAVVILYDRLIIAKRFEKEI
jgi:hypothetical protein